jgi:membrane-bound serine protease (ClpP class)
VRARANKVVTGNRGMLGEAGVVLTALAPAGKIMVRGEYWDATAPAGSTIEPGAKVRVTGVKGLKLDVQPDSSSRQS